MATTFPRRKPAAAPIVTDAAPEARVHAAIHEAILDHRLTPGTKLKELQMAEIFGVSRATVRTALARLAHVHLVELRPNRGAVVASPSPEESRDVFEARRAIECAIVALAAGNATKKTTDALRAHVAAEQSAYDRNDQRAGLRLSIEFHRRLAAAAGNAVLARYLDELVSRTPLIVLMHRGPTHSTCSCDDHIALVEALTVGDGERAATIMRHHLDELEGQLNLQRPEPPRSLHEVFAATA